MNTITLNDLNNFKNELNRIINTNVVITFKLKEHNIWKKLSLNINRLSLSKDIVIDDIQYKIEEIEYNVNNNNYNIILNPKSTIISDKEKDYLLDKGWFVDNKQIKTETDYFGKKIKKIVSV